MDLFRLLKILWAGDLVRTQLGSFVSVPCGLSSGHPCVCGEWLVSWVLVGSSQGHSQAQQQPGFQLGRCGVYPCAPFPGVASLGSLTWRMGSRGRMPCSLDSALPHYLMLSIGQDRSQGNPGKDLGNHSLTRPRAAPHNRDGKNSQLRFSSSGLRGSLLCLHDLKLVYSLPSVPAPPLCRDQ